MKVMPRRSRHEGHEAHEEKYYCSAGRQDLTPELVPVPFLPFILFAFFTDETKKIRSPLHPPSFAIPKPQRLRALRVLRGAICTLFILMASPAFAYQEAPMLAERVARGELPSVVDRLPENPAVVEPVESIGRYGGSWRRLAVGPADIGLNSRLGYESLVRWDRGAIGVIPGLAERWDVLDGGRRYVFHLRKGTRWSDGAPFTSEDLMFWFEDVLGNKELTPVFPSWLTLDGEPVHIAAPDPYWVEFRFGKPYGIFLEFTAFNGISMFYPKHYLKQFHPKYADKTDLEQKAKAKGMAFWHQLFGRMANCEQNVDLPTLKPFVLRTPPPATRLVAERNAYYWKVDPAGNQLPYLDSIVYTMVQSPEILNFKAMTGDADFQDRRIDAANFPLFMENRQKGRYRVLRDGNPTPVVVYVNPCSPNADLRDILRDRRFRIALSTAINRPELIQLIYSDMAQPSRGIASPFDPYYLPEFEADYMNYDPALSNRLLDELGLTRGRDGLRRLPSGKPFREMLNVYPAETGVGPDLWQLVVDYWREVGLDFTVKVDAVALSVMQTANGNTNFWAYAASGMMWIVDPIWYVPWTNFSYFAPLYGRYYATNGKGGVEPPEEYRRLREWYLELRSCVGNDARKLELGRNILRQFSESCYTIGICRPDLLAIVSNRFRNVPEHIVHDYRVMTPGYIGIEQFYIDEGR